MTTTLDLRSDYARLNPPKELPALEFDLTGAHALIGAIKPITDAHRADRNRFDKQRQMAKNERAIADELDGAA